MMPRSIPASGMRGRFDRLLLWPAPSCRSDDVRNDCHATFVPWRCSGGKDPSPSPRRRRSIWPIHGTPRGDGPLCRASSGHPAKSSRGARPIRSTEMDSACSRFGKPWAARSLRVRHRPRRDMIAPSKSSSAPTAFKSTPFRIRGIGDRFYCRSVSWSGSIPSPRAESPSGPGDMLRSRSKTKLSGISDDVA